MQIRIRKGLDIPIAGWPAPTIHAGKTVGSVALLGGDTPGLKPSMSVAVGDPVRLGQPLFIDKRNPKVPYTSPGTGRVAAINRGERRVLQSVVVELDGTAEETFPSFDSSALHSLTADEVRRILLGSGQWTALRTRPFSRVPAPDATPHSVFVTAIDTNPLAADPALIIAQDAEAFAGGLRLVAKLSDGPTYLCTAAGVDLRHPGIDSVRTVAFSGPHPAGLVGTHIHFLDPVGMGKTVWHIGYQDVIAIGHLFLSGRIRSQRIVALGGPMVASPRLLRTRVGANLMDLVADELLAGDRRIVSGSVLSGHRATGRLAWLGRYDNQVSVLREGGPREFLAWAMPGTHRYSASKAFLGHLVHRGDFALTTTQNGSPRAMVSTGSFERVMPLDILPTLLLKAVLVRDTESAQELGCLELDEEDLALCSFVCNGKYDYGTHLRQTLTEIELNG